MPQEIKGVANHVLYVDLLGFTTGMAKGRVISNSNDLSFEMQRHIYQKDEGCDTDEHRLEEGRCAQAKEKADTVNEIDSRPTEWQETPMFLVEVEEAPLG